jgi:oligoribonuclease NrnB/cAMP/cGMP phosphodiesterase (DHH superfamily)
MTDGTTKIKAADDGGTTSDLSAQETATEPAYGFARLRESEVYHLMLLVQSALSETEYVVRTIEEKARERWMDHHGTTEPLDKDEISRLLSDAYQCATKAATVIDETAVHWLDWDLPDEPVPYR